MRWLALDLGSKTIGLALSDAEETIASPLQTLARTTDDQVITQLASLAEEHDIQALLMGLPLTLDGEQGLMAKRVQSFGDKLATALKLPIRYWDERFSTVAAERALLDADMSRKNRKKVVNHVAAAYFLQGFLDYLKQGDAE